MSQSRENSFNLTSPRSSTGAGDAFRATPDTRLTAFSSEDGSAESSKSHQNFSGSSAAATPVKPPINSCQSHVSQLDKDPFVTPIHNTRLSPTASTFSPDSESFAFSQNNGPIATVLSTELGISHDLHVSSSNPVSISEVDACLTDLVEKGAKLRGNHEFQVIGERVSIHFSDIRDACWAFSALQLMNKSWSVTYAARDITADGPNGLSEKLLHLGQVHFIANPPSGSSIHAAQMTEAVQRVLQSCGDLFAFVRQISYPDGSFRGIAQFCKASDALVAIRTCNGITTGGIHIAVAPPTSKASATHHITEAFQDFSLTKAPAHPYQHEVTSSQVTPTLPSQSALSMYPFMIQSPLAPNMPFLLDHVPPPGPMSAAGSMTSTYPMIRPLYQTPPSPAMTVRADFSPSRTSSGYPKFDTRRQNAARIVRSPYHNSANHHNHVDISRIRDGIDVRTTIMLRNIPNKVDQVMLKRIIDDSSWGKYDFMYLRIDFANDCNVGYAFINFVDPLDIIDFVNARGNQRWNCFKSDKVAEISYATIQGKDCLVQKFRNSSVMLEAPHYRPKLFFTSNGPMPELAGQEEAFPEPDNQSKMKRSCENAEHVGLFTPNSGQHFRDEQRRRRSQYDRGTRLAALEEYDYDTAIQQYYGPSTQ